MIRERLKRLGILSELIAALEERTAPEDPPVEYETAREQQAPSPWLEVMAMLRAQAEGRETAREDQIIATFRELGWGEIEDPVVWLRRRLAAPSPEPDGGPGYFEAEQEEWKKDRDLVLQLEKRGWAMQSGATGAGTGWWVTDEASGQKLGVGASPAAAMHSALAVADIWATKAELDKATKAT